MEFITSFIDPGEVTLNMNYTPTGYDEFNDEFEAGTEATYTIILSNTEATQYSFSALVTNVSMNIPAEEAVSLDVTLKITGVVSMSS